MPHVMTYEEIVAASKSGKIIYEEVRLKDWVRPLKFNGVDFVGVKDKHCYLMLMECDEEECMDYNLYYRCWDQKPSDELRKNTPWKENPYRFFEFSE